MTGSTFIPNDAELPGLAGLLSVEGAPGYILVAAARLTGREPAGEVERSYTRYWPGRRCVVQWTYAMGGGEEPMVVSAELLSPKELAKGREGIGELLADEKAWVQVFPNDRILPAIAKAVDPSWIRTTLAPSLGLAGDAIAARPVSYKSWRRCVIEYDIDGRRFYGKLFRDDRGAELTDLMQRLDAALASAGQPWRLPRTVLYDPELQMVVQEGLEDAYSLSEVLPEAPDDEAAREELIAAVRKAARSLLGLQRTKLNGLETFAASDAYQALVEDIDDIARVEPEAAEELRDRLSNLEKLYRDIGTEDLATAHSAFRHSHIIQTPDGQALLDLDNVGLRGVNADAGYFLGYLEYSMIRRKRLQEVLAQCREAFLEEWSRYDEYHPFWLAFHTQYVLMKWAIRSFFSLDEDWRRIFDKAGSRVKSLRREAMTTHQSDVTDPLLALAGDKRRVRQMASDVVAASFWPGSPAETVDSDFSYSPGEEAVTTALLSVGSNGDAHTERLILTFKPEDQFEDVRREAEQASASGFWVSPENDFFAEVFPRDFQLPGLALSTDNDRVAALLGRAGALPAGEVTSFEHEVLRYRAHERCVIRYTATLRSGEQKRFVAKVYEDAATAREVWTILRALRNQLQDPVLVVKPLALDLEASMVFMENIDGERVGDLMDETNDAAEVQRYVDMTAKALAGLHGLTLDHERVKVFATELEKLRVHERASGAVSEEMGSALKAALDTIEAKGSRLAAVVPGFVHGGFKPTQMLLRANGDVSVVDFDGSCIGDQAIDVGRFMAKTRVDCMQPSRANLKDLDQYFLDRYIEHSGRDVRDRARIYQSLSLVRMASRRFETRPGAFQRGGLEARPSGVLLREAMTCLGMA